MIKPWPIHTLVLDFDDTLIAERDYVASGYRAAGKWALENLGITDFAETAWNLFERGRRGKVFDEALVASGFQAKTETVDDLLRAYRSHIPQLSLLPEAVDLLDWAVERFNLAVISDGYLEVQERKVAAVGLRRWVQDIVLTDVWGKKDWKPSPRGFEEVMRKVKGAPLGYVYVADNPRKDFTAPRALGWHTIRIRRPNSEHASIESLFDEGPDAEITDLADLKGLLRH